MKSPVQIIVSNLTNHELRRMEARVWKEMTAGDGYQPFGYDRPTLQATCPEHLEALDYIRAEMRYRIRSGDTNAQAVLSAD